MKISVCLLVLFFSLPAMAQLTSSDELTNLRSRLAQDEKQLADWPQLQRYAEANAKVLPPHVGEMRVVFMGDSITDSWGNGSFGPFFPGRPYIGRGIGGQTTPQMLLRFRQDAIGLRPKAVIIHAGTNDIAGNTGPATLAQIVSNFESMADLAKFYRIKVIFASVLPVNDYVARPNGEQIIQTKQRPPEKILELNKWLKDYADRNGDVYLDYFSAMVDEHGFLKKDITYDGLHPNEKGYGIMAPLAERAIQKALKLKTIRKSHPKVLI